jgi:hypothetical protein
MVQLTCAKSMQSIYCRHNHVHKINTKLCNIQLISSIHTKNSRGKDRQLWTNSRAFCNHPLAVMVHWSSKAWMENWRGQPQCSSWCFWSKKRLENWRKDIHATVAILIFFISGGLILIHPVHMEDMIHDSYGGNPDVWNNRSLNGQWCAP